MNIARLSVVTALVLLAGCAQKGAQPTGTAAAPKPMATVNGQPLTTAQFELFSKAVAGKASSELNAA